MATRPLRSFQDQLPQESQPRRRRRDPPHLEVERRIKLMQETLARQQKMFGGSKRRLYESEVYDLSLFEGIPPIVPDTEAA